MTHKEAHMRSIAGTLNSVELIGWLGNDTELKTIGAKSKVRSFSVATKRMTGNASSGYGFESEWMTVEAWDKLAERCAKNLSRGSRVLVRGSLLTQSWDDKQTGVKRYKTVVRASDCVVLSPVENDDTTEEAEEE
jgi:single-strand DNA-binding protein